MRMIPDVATTTKLRQNKAKKEAVPITGTFKAKLIHQPSSGVTLALISNQINGIKARLTFSTGLQLKKIELVNNF